MPVEQHTPDPRIVELIASGACYGSQYVVHHNPEDGQPRFEDELGRRLYYDIDDPAGAWVHLIRDYGDPIRDPAGRITMSGDVTVTIRVVLPGLPELLKLGVTETRRRYEKACELATDGHEFFRRWHDQRHLHLEIPDNPWP